MKDKKHLRQKIHKDKNRSTKSSDGRHTHGIFPDVKSMQIVR